MNKKYIYLASISIFIILLVIVVFKYVNRQPENTTYTLLPRKGSAANSREWLEQKKNTDSLLGALKEDKNDVKSALKLAALYIQEARVSGNYAYYDMAAMKYVNDVLAFDSSNFNARVFKSLIYMSQHHFAEGLAEAKVAQQINPYNAYVYGLLVDGNVEFGNYDSAVAYADKMVSIRPDLTSYSRVSYLREIFGDYPGAISAMKLAAEAGGRGDENTEWTRTQLGNLYEKTNNYVTADSLYSMSLAMRPNYPFAMAGLARKAIAAKDYNKAINYYQKATSVVEDDNIKEELADAYRQAGQKDKADKLEKEVIDDLNKSAEAGNNNENIGHYADRELAYAYLKVNDVNKALEHALTEYNRRPNNIDVNQTVAWVYYKRGEYAKALPYIKTALKTNSKNPILLSQAALIYNKTGNDSLAKSLLDKTSVTNPYIGYDIMTSAAALKQKLQ